MNFTFSRQRRSEMVDQCLRASFMAMEAWRQLETGNESSETNWKYIGFLQKAFEEMGPWAKLIGRPLLQPIMLKLRESN